MRRRRSRARYQTCLVIPGCATWRRPGIHTPDCGYGFRARSFHSRPGMTAPARVGRVRTASSRALQIIIRALAQLDAAEQATRRERSAQRPDRRGQGAVHGELQRVAHRLCTRRLLRQADAAQYRTSRFGASFAAAITGAMSVTELMTISPGVS